MPHKEEKLAPHRVGRAGGKGPGDGSAMQAKKGSFDYVNKKLEPDDDCE